MEGRKSDGEGLQGRGERVQGGERDSEGLVDRVTTLYENFAHVCPVYRRTTYNSFQIRSSEGGP